MAELVATFESDLRRWSVTSDAVPSISGVATASLGAGLAVHVDAVTGALVEVAIDAEPDGSVSPSVRGLVEHLMDGDLVEGAALRVRPEHADDLIRLALLERGAAEAAAVGEPSPWWSVERRALADRLGVAGSVEVTTEIARGGRPRALAVTDDGEFERELEAMLAAADVVVGEAVPVSLSGAREWIEHIGVDLGRLPGDEGGPMFVDAGFVRPGLLDLRRGCRVVSHDAWSVTVFVSTAQVYASQVAEVVVVALDRNGTVVALCPLAMGPGLDGAIESSANLVLRPDRDRRDLRVLVTSNPSAIPSTRVLDRRSRARLGLLAASASRLAGSELAAELWRRAVTGSLWEGESLVAYRGRPFAAEVDLS